MMVITNKPTYYVIDSVEETKISTNTNIIGVSITYMNKDWFTI